MTTTDCGWSGPLPPVGETRPCEACRLFRDQAEAVQRTYGDVRRCQINGQRPPPPALPPVEQPAQCIHLGQWLFDEPCSCGSSSKVPVHQCGLLTFEASGKPRKCVPARHSMIADELLRVATINCHQCPSRSADSLAEAQSR